ncbi:hypothetical protein BH23PLA1_BH23PLA1_44650 [soil metagenome]
MVHRYAAFFLLAALLAPATGCRSLNDRGFLQPQVREPVVEARPEFDVQPLIDRHNQNARQVDSFRDSELFVNVKTFTKPNGRERPLLFAGRADGWMVMERPENCRLVLRSMGSDLVDIGSNEEGFWFGNGMQKEIVVGQYDQLSSNPLAATIQPEWIFEAIGLREIPEGVQHQLLKDGQTVALVERREIGGEVFRKVTYLNRTSGDVLMHSLFAGDHKDPIAQATITRGYHEVVPTDAPGGGSTVRLPKEIHLNIPDVAQLTVTFRAPEVNPDGINRALVFSEPDKSRDGYARRDIREYLPTGPEYAAASGSGSGSGDSSSRLYETLPSPPTTRQMDEEARSGLTHPIARREELAPRDSETRSSAVELLTEPAPARGTETRRPLLDVQAPVEGSSTRTSAVFESQIPRGPEPGNPVRTWKPDGRFPREVMGGHDR